MAGADTNIAVASNALQLIGSNPISSFADADSGAVVANNIFDDIAESLISSYPWTFAKKQSDALNLLAAVPETKWTAAYQLPSDLLSLRTIMVNGSPIDYEVFGDQVYCDAAAIDSVFAIYTHYADVSVWPPSFRLYMVYTLASLFAMSVAMKPDISAGFNDMAEMQGRKARTLDAQSQTSEKVRTNRFITNRR